jgi:hypothetical protein
VKVYPLRPLELPLLRRFPHRQFGWIQSISSLDHAHIWRYPLSGPPDVCTVVFPLYIVVEGQALEIPLKDDLLDGVQPKQLELLQMLVFLQKLQGIVE